MGMAASQARWISLAARKTNVEYEGQQINQARTALANQSSELWNRLYKMDVPVPPSTVDFTKTKYTFDIGDSTKTITDIQSADYTDPDDGITYNSYVTYTADVILYKGIRITNSNPQVQYVSSPSEGKPYYMVGTKKLTCMGNCDPKSDDWETYTTALQQIAADWPDSTVGKEWSRINPDPTVPPSSDASQYSHIHFWKDSQNNVNFVIDGKDSSIPQYTSMSTCDPESTEWTTCISSLEQYVAEFPDSTVAQEWNRINPDPAVDPSNDPSLYSNIYFWKNNQGGINFTTDPQTTPTVNAPYDTLEYCIQHPDEALHSYYASNQKVQQSVSKYAVIEYDSSGRATTIQLEKSSAVYNITTTTQTDDDAYNDAMNKYYYEKQQYEKKVQDINAKTEQIQTEDRTLELRLKQLDTEQNALQTEMDAVHKVISKNIEGTFKTFES